MTEHKMFCYQCQETAGCTHIPGGVGEEKDFSALIEHAKRCAPPKVPSFPQAFRAILGRLF